MHMTKRNDHLYRQREQRQLCKWSTIHRLIDPDPLANTCPPNYVAFSTSSAFFVRRQRALPKLTCLSNA